MANSEAACPGTSEFRAAIGDGPRLTPRPNPQHSPGDLPAAENNANGDTNNNANPNPNTNTNNSIPKNSSKSNSHSIDSSNLIERTTATAAVDSGSCGKQQHPQQQQQQDRQHHSQHATLNAASHAANTFHSVTATTTTTTTPNNGLSLINNSSGDCNVSVSDKKPPRTSSSLGKHRSLPPSAPGAPIASLGIRKTAPGLAARLKALGIGGFNDAQAEKDSQNSHALQIGRLSEEQIRELDKKLTGSSSAITIERKGRPWKGPTSSSAASSLSRRPSSPNDRDSPKPELPHPQTTVESPPSEDNYTSDASCVDDTLPSPTKEPNTCPEAPPQSSSILSAAPQSESPVHDMDEEQRVPTTATATATATATIIATPSAPPSAIATTTAIAPSNDQPTTSWQNSPRHSDKSCPVSPTSATPATTITTPAATTNATATTDMSARSPSPVTDPFERTGDFNKHRPGSIYTLSRASFANQLARLTSLQLPDSASLSGKIRSLPTAEAACKALIQAAEQIRSWISQAAEVIEGLDSDDDVEWSAAGGREGLADVESAIARFKGVIKVYIGAIEDLQDRVDISSVSRELNKRAVAQMEIIVAEWTKIDTALQSVKDQVEIAMEWEELWEQVLGDIQSEMDILCKLVFEMEERRHHVTNGELADNRENLDTISEENSAVHAAHSQPVRLNTTKRPSLSQFPLSPNSPRLSFSHEDSSLLALFARMQPLRASLDFLPMRLAGFMSKAKSFPTACDELEMRKAALEACYKKLEKDAESLRKELGEDRWLLVFRGAGRQAQKMYESVERSVLKLQEAVDARLYLTNQPAMLKKIESFDAKKTHYSPAIDRILAMIDKGVRDRLTVNGEIMRLHIETRTKWEALKNQMREMDKTLEEIAAEQQRSQQMRDSISSMLSNDASILAENTGGLDTPGSSPPSSVVMSTLGLDQKTPTAKGGRATAIGGPSQPPGRRNFSMPNPSRRASVAPSRLTSFCGTPPRPAAPTRPDTRPRWNSSTNTSDLCVGHNFKPLTLTLPSPYSKQSTPRSAAYSTPDSTESNKTGVRSSPSISRLSSSVGVPQAASLRSSHRDRGGPQATADPTRLAPSTCSSAGRPIRRHSENVAADLQLKSTTGSDSNSSRRTSTRSNTSALNAQPQRPSSGMTQRRSSMLPVPKGRSSFGHSDGRSTPGLDSSRSASRAGKSRRGSTAGSVTGKEMPRWRY